MHIPDGYLGPQTYLAAYGVMAPLWAAALRRVKKTIRTRQVPLLAMGAAFSFLIMMFNIPIPGGTTGHAAGGVLVAILLGPWAAVVAVSLALAVQAFLFGDGGVTALGANCFNIAFVMPMVGWWVYKLIAGKSDVHSSRRIWAAAIGGYAGLNAAALFTSLLIGVQPLIAHDETGRALYCPYGLKVAVPVMMIEHLSLFGFVEALVTGLVVARLCKSDSELLRVGEPSHSMTRKMAWAIAILAVLVPLGLWLPEHFGAGGAWGEWGVSELAERVGFTPARMDRLASLWASPMPDYALPGQEGAPLAHLSLSYILSALIGVAVLSVLVWGMRAWLVGKTTAEKTT